MANAGETLGFRGSGCSYGDASINASGKLLDLKHMNKILDFDAASGLATVEPGVTIEQLWQHTIPHGYWPAVVPGTMKVSVGGAASMNIHGKNNYAVGSFGEHINSFELVTAAGDTLHCSKTQHPELFHAAIGGFGMLGCMTKIELQLKRVHSGQMKVSALVAKDLSHQFDLFEELQHNSDYLVSWVDLHANQPALGRGVLHRGVHFQPGEDPQGDAYLRADAQQVPKYLLGLYPKQWVWPWMWITKNLGLIPWVNAAKMKAGVYEERKGTYLQSHGAFHFLLDYVPRWHWMTKPGGLIQFQPFVPFDAAHDVLSGLIADCHKAGLVAYLGVLKRHRKDPFLMTHGLDGYSLAMDFAVPTSPQRRKELWDLCARMTDRVLDAQGRFYYAKDLTMSPSCPEKIHGAAALETFRALKRKYDPSAILGSSLARRLAI